MKSLSKLTCAIVLILLSVTFAAAQRNMRDEQLRERNESKYRALATEADRRAGQREAATRVPRVGGSINPNGKKLFPASFLTTHEVRQLRVAEVMDGDTIIVADGSKTRYRIRIQSIDAPELQQSFGKDAKQHLADLLEGKEIDLTFYGENNLKRNALSVAKVFIGGRDVSYEQLDAGLAWFLAEDKMIQSVEDYEMYKELENSAREAKRGLWQEASPQSPSQYKQNLP
jgi:micrococcal nuclease